MEKQLMMTWTNQNTLLSPNISTKGGPTNPTFPFISSLISASETSLLPYPLQISFHKNPPKALGLSSPSPPSGAFPFPPIMSQPPLPPPSHPSSDPPRLRPLLKQNSWSPDFYREEAWLRRKGRANRRSKSVTDEDLDELKACFELGFGFDSPDLDPKLSDAFPAYGLYHAVNKQYKYNDVVSKSSSSLPASDSDLLDLPSPVGSPLAMFSPGEDPKRMKTRLRQWAQVVACSVKHSCT